MTTTSVNRSVRITLVLALAAALISGFQSPAEAAYVSSCNVSPRATIKVNGDFRDFSATAVANGCRSGPPDTSVTK